jgi:phosphoglycerol transferase
MSQGNRGLRVTTSTLRGPVGPIVDDKDASGGRRTWRSGTAFYASLALVSTALAIWVTGLSTHAWGIPLAYAGDALAGGAQFKAVLETGWYETNPALGAPFGQVMHDFPVADNFQFVCARIAGLFTDQWAVAYNATYLITFPLAALAAADFFRVVGTSRTAAFGFGLLFAFAPYHFLRGISHLSLSQYFVVPLVAGLAIKVLVDKPLWVRRGAGDRRNPVSWVTGTTVITLLVLLVTGSTSSYYAVFGLLFLFAAALVVAVRGQVRAALGAAVAMVGLIGVMLANMLPDILYAHGRLPAAAGFIRTPQESELYALKLAALVFPTNWSRIGPLDEWRITYDTDFPLLSEQPVLGMVAAMGFLFLLAVPVARMMGWRAHHRGGAHNSYDSLAYLTFVGFLFGTVGGLGTIFAVVVSPDIRAWNRISICLMLFALAGAALLVDGGARRLVDRLASGWAAWARTSTALIMCLVIVSFGLFDQVAPRPWDQWRAERTEWANDKAYARAVEDRVPPGTAIFQLPFLAFPESPPAHEMTDYDPLRPYLHASGLEWSYGGLRGRPSADWAEKTAARPPAAMLVALGSSGFGGVHVDRYGYPGRDTDALEDELASILDTKPITSPDDRYAFYDMSEFNERLADAYSRVDLAEIKRHTVDQPILYWQGGFAPPVPDAAGVVMTGKSATPELIIDNPGTAISMRLSFQLRAESSGEPASVGFSWPDGREEDTVVPDDGGRFARTFKLPAGRSTIAFSVDGAPSISLVNTSLDDPFWDSRVPKGLKSRQ